MKQIYVKEVLGFNGLPYGDYNRQVFNRREIWFFYLQWNDFMFGLTSCCDLDKKHANCEENHSENLNDRVINSIAQWLLKN